MDPFLKTVDISKEFYGVNGGVDILYKSWSR